MPMPIVGVRRRITISIDVLLIIGLSLISSVWAGGLSIQGGYGGGPQPPPPTYGGGGGGYPAPAPQPSYPTHSLPSPSYPQPQPAPTYPDPAPQPSYPQPQPQPVPQPYPDPAPQPQPYPSPAPQPYPQPTPAPSYPQPQPTPAPYPAPAPGPSYPAPAPQPSYPQPQPQPSYPGPAPQPSYPGPAAVGYPGPAPAPGGYGGGGSPAPGPDTSDPCFRRYANCIIVNAQPYERRSTVDIAACKDLCTSSTTGVFQCRSFVYDNQNQVCDLFGHTGNQYPAKLITFYNRDYYEPTGTCNGAVGGGTTTVTSPPIAGEGPTCPLGQDPRLLRIEGFMLQGSDDVTHSGAANIDECIQACFDNRLPDGTSAPCQSFDFTDGNCIFTEEAAVPTGNGQLVQSANSDYYEKICVDSAAAAQCPQVFERFPQMILVGFAETVVDANGFEECLDNCLNSQSLYGFRCASGMFYFQEDQLNCILNTEDRTSQPDLFVQEDNDIVDYFETGCADAQTLSSTRRRFAARQSVLKPNATEVKQSESTRLLTSPINRDRKSLNKTPKLAESNDDFLYEDSGASNRRNPDFGQWTQWSPCDRSVDGRRVRYKRCRKANLKECEAQTEWCNRESLPENTHNLDALQHAAGNDGEGGLQCPDDKCCAVFGGCRIGLKRDTVTGNIRWCTDPCKAQA